MKGCPLLAGILLLGTVATAAPHTQKPYVVRLSLAGVKLDERFIDIQDRYDPVQRCFLMSTGDCDGASLDIILTPDPAVFFGPDFGEDRHFVKSKLPPVRSGWGVNLGDTPQQVQSKLGERPHKTTKRSRWRETTWTYNAKIRKTGTERGLMDYRARYVFRNGRLFGIHYNLHDSEGC